jgi:hypothetical protein
MNTYALNKHMKQNLFRCRQGRVQKVHKLYRQYGSKLIINSVGSKAFFFDGNLVAAIWNFVYLDIPL